MVSGSIMVNRTGNPSVFGRIDWSKCVHSSDLHWHLGLMALSDTSY
jgi:hypothetical protein